MGLPKFETVRVVVLLIALISVGLVSVHQIVYTRGWNRTLEVTVFPINADGHLQTADYINRLHSDTFTPINTWAEREAERYDLDLKTPFNVSLGAQINNLPPEWPSKANPIAVLFWGLRFRWWAFRNTPDDGGGLTRIRMFVLYYEGEEEKALAHSLGMQKGLLGLVHVFADSRQTAQNNVVIAHEMLHTVGAIDKYDSFGGPVFPYGYANAHRQPLFPQRHAEIMAGRIPTSNYASYMAESLRSTQVNLYTAQEINWVN